MGFLKDASSPYLTLTETADGSIPNATTNEYHLFVDTDGSLKMKDDAGSVVNIGEAFVPGFAVPTVVLDQTASEGTSPDALRSDAHIVAFDAFDPEVLVFGNTADDGSGATAAKRNHRHLMPAQQAANADTSGATLANLEIEVNQLKAALRAVGIIAT